MQILQEQISVHAVEKKVTKEKATRLPLTSCPSADARHPCRAPNGLFSIKAPVLCAANGRNTSRA